MIASRRFYQKPSFWRWAVMGLMFVLFAYAFRGEINTLWLSLRGIPSPFFHLGWKLLTKQVGPDRATDAILVMIKFFGLGFVFLNATFVLVAQFVLPVETLQERLMVFSRLWLYFIRRHGPAIFVKEGKKIAKPGELESLRAGVAFVDLSSAVVLEKAWKSPPKKPSVIVRMVNRLLGRREPLPPSDVQSRVGGPGIVFTQKNEKIQGIVDLRKQFRIAPEDVFVYTSDGIELKGRVFVGFTLGMDADVLNVGYCWDEAKDSSEAERYRPENLRSIQIDEFRIPDPHEAMKYRKVKYIRSVADDLDALDRAEINRFDADRRAMHRFINDLDPIREDLVHNFIRRIQPADEARVHEFIRRLFADNKANLHSFIDRMAPLEQGGVQRLVIDKETVLEFVAQLYQNGERELRASALRFTRLLFSTYQGYVQRFVVELDDSSQRRINEFVRRYGSKTPKKRARPAKPWFNTPYIFNEKRVFSAIYARGRNPRGANLQEWADLPLQTAIELFRNQISQVTYDALYLPEDPVKYPVMHEIKPTFSRLVRYQGILSFALLERRDGKPIKSLPPEQQKFFNDYKNRRAKCQNDTELAQLESELQAQVTQLDSEAVNAQNYVERPAQELLNSKVLRDRGIKVIFAGFSELHPSNPIVRRQRYENWRARWLKEEELVKADHDLEVMRIRNRARAQAQREMTFALSQILNDGPLTREAMALRVFQALETAAADPATRQLVPHETLDMLRSIRVWLLPEENQPIMLNSPSIPPSAQEEAQPGKGNNEPKTGNQAS